MSNSTDHSTGRPLRTQPPLTAKDERNWAVAAHLSALAGGYLALGYLGPLVVMLYAGPRSPFVRRHAVEALNAGLSALLYVAVCALLVIVVIGIPLLVVVGLGYLVAAIAAAITAGHGEAYRYPFRLRFVR